MKVRMGIFIIYLFAASSLMAQSGSSVGLGGAYSAIARGSEAIFWNPANLALRDSSVPSVSISLFSIKLNAGNNALTRSLYDEYFTDENKVLYTYDINKILGKIPDSGLVVDMDADASVLAIAIKNFGISVSASAFTKVNTPKTLFEIPFTGIGHKTYKFNPEGDGEAVAKINLAYGHIVARNITINLLKKIHFQEIAFGGSFGYLIGIGSIKIDHANLTAIVNDAGISAKGFYSAKGTDFEQNDIGGSGKQINLAISARTTSNYTISLVFKNIFHRVSWNKTNKEYRGTLDTGDPKFIMGSGQLADLDGDEIFTDEELSIGSFSTSRPLEFSFGIGRTIDKYTYAMELGTDNEEFMFAIGGGIKIAIIQLYSAYSHRMSHNFNFGLGIGGKHFLLDFGICTRGSFIQSLYKGLTFGSSLRVGF